MARAAKAALGLLLVVVTTAGCLRLISAERLEDGSAVMCVRVEPTDAGADADGVSAAPAMRYVPAHAPEGSVAP